MQISLRQIPCPVNSFSSEQPKVPPDEYEQRIQALYDAAKSDWVVVYADREHFANLTFLINFDPRFEEALLLLGPGRSRFLVVGNEGLGYTSVIPIPLEILLCQTFSLPGQQRDKAPRLKDVLLSAGMRKGQSVSVIGWKYAEINEVDEPSYPSFVPVHVVKVLSAIVGDDKYIVDGTPLMIGPEKGIRSVNSAEQIAAFEWAACQSSNAVFSILRRSRPGMSEYQAAQCMGYSGLPMSMHPIFTSGKGDLNGLRSPGARRIEYGDAVSTAVGYWGSLCCRAGWMMGEPDMTLFEGLVAPYFRVIAAWYANMKIGARGGDIFSIIEETFLGSGIRSSLNPGHLISLDEWTHSPIRPLSDDRIRSGMVLQCDIIPTPLPPGNALNCEDTIAVADAHLREEMSRKYPELWERIQRRRNFMTGQLGLTLAEDTLPLSDFTAYLPPFWLCSDLVCFVEA